MKESWEAVHLMFYEACRCDEVSEAKTKLMYWAVYHFGPRWREVKEMRAETRTENGKEVTAKIEVSRPVRVSRPASDEEIVKKAEKYFETHNPSLKEIESLEL